jgi:hypothetical protein
MYRWRVTYQTPAGPQYRTYHGDEVRVRKIAESVERRHKWRMRQMVRQW